MCSKVFQGITHLLCQHTPLMSSQHLFVFLRDFEGHHSVSLHHLGISIHDHHHCASLSYPASSYVPLTSTQQFWKAMLHLSGLLWEFNKKPWACFPRKALNVFYQILDDCTGWDWEQVHWISWNGSQRPSRRWKFEHWLVPHMPHPRLECRATWQLLKDLISTFHFVDPILHINWHKD